MNFLHVLVCDYGSDLLRSVPIPRSFREILSLSFKDVVGLAVFGSVSAALGYSVYTTLKLHLCNKEKLINYDITKHVTKRVDVVDLESIGEKKTYCRCWRSTKFPYCDGSHNEHNKMTGDNVGPLVIEPKKTA